MKSVLLATLFCTALLACKTTDQILQDYQGPRLVIANGGGFTGQVIEYTLLGNGYIYRYNSLTNSNSFHKRIGKNETNQIFNSYKLLKIDEMKLNDPGNMYFYIKRSDKGQVQEVKWNTDSQGQNMETAKLFYQTVLQRIK